MRRLLSALFGLGIVMGQPVTVPLIVEGNAPMVELEFSSPAGVRKARFLVDTGGGAFILGSKLMADIGAKAAGPPFKEEVTLVPLAPMPVKMGGMALDLTGVTTLGSPNERGPSTRNSAEGLIPGRLLRKYEVIFDYPAGQFTLAKPGASNPRGIKLPTPISSPSAFPRIELQIAGATYGFLLDTGASFTMISRTVLERWSKAKPSWPTATGAVSFANMFGGKVENEGLMLRIAEVGIGPIAVKAAAAVSRPAGTFEKYMTAMMTAPIVGALGGNVLREFRLEIDYKNGFTYLDRTTPAPDTDMVTVGLVLSPAADGTLVISAISSTASPDVKAQVHVGDKLVAVDDVPMQGKPLAGAALALHGKAGAQLRLSLKHDGMTRVVSVTIKELL